MPVPKTKTSSTDATLVNTTSDTPYYLLTPSETATELSTSLDAGLSASAIAPLQARDGLNLLSSGGGVSVVSILAAQVFNAMVLVLIICLCVSLAIRSWIESGALIAVIVINVIVGFIQEYSSAKSMDSLRSLASPTAHVIRDGKTVVVPSKEVVAGDLVEVKTGDVIPADLRLVESMNFETDEALLTGESLPVAKDPLIQFGIKEGDKEVDLTDIGVGDRINMAYASSTVTKGRAKGIVVAIGMNTEIGKIATSLRGGDTKVRKVRRNEDGHAPFHRYLSAYALTFTDNTGRFLGVNVGTPLQRRLSQLAILLFGIALVFALIVFAANGFDSEREITLYAVATGVSMIPASLKVVLTITLAGGTKIMVSRNVVVRRLDSLEALGAVTDVCSDKTGTLTQGKMVVRAAWLPAAGTVTVADVTEPFNPLSGKLSFSKLAPIEHDTTPEELSASEIRQALDVDNLLNVASLCNLAKIVRNDDGSWIARGDPTESAIQLFAHRFNWGREQLTGGERPEWAQLAEYPFASDIKRMSVIYAKSGTASRMVFTKGAVERVLESCTRVQCPEGPRELHSELESAILANVGALAEQGLRVLALAQKTWSGDSDAARDEVEKDLILVGLVGLYDPPRPETKAAVEECHAASIGVHMLTGDHVDTAKAIALQVGILPENIKSLPKSVIDSMVLTASQFDKMTDEEIDAMPLLPLVIARCAPHTKVRMVDALHRRKKFCAMTGDGVNDSPSLKRADVGIAMGLAGSDVAKDASDIVLTDDNFASILAAVEEGRRIFDNIKKFILHLLAQVRLFRPGDGLDSVRSKSLPPPQNVIQALVLLVGLCFKDNEKLSVFPLSPVEILWVIMISSTFPAMGLGGHQAESGIMLRPPHDLAMGVFTWEVLADIAAYGIFSAGLCLATFTLIVFGFNDGNLGTNSNNSVGDGSGNVFKARSATFAVITWLSLLLAYEVVDSRKSLFDSGKNSKRPYTQWILNLYTNRFLFWSCFLGLISVIPVIYIPIINESVFKHSPITWEWGLVFVANLLFVAFAEGWKAGKRVYFRRKEAKGGERVEKDPFGMWGMGEKVEVV